ncbi:uncharacterized protein LOC131677031 [Topomyia yanbarensis]|uniref:uncharacterized protein LOC131677031 n=1 Tax=Topomyia yanbarensis TaxID=2498891 RepID=UPI00273B0DAC|nr:uncharacterized protein LOC131677031 [Topomyia yanbarensis]
MCCCCCVKISLNLLQRISNDITELVYCQRWWPRPPFDIQSSVAQSCASLRSTSVGGNEDQYQCHRLPHDTDNDPQQQKPSDGSTDVADGKGTDLMPSGVYNVIYDTVEIESYYYNVDRLQSEQMLKGHRVGSCLVRPFKLKHARIRYILTIHVAGSYFHLFIRRTGFNSTYALGLQKPRERYFKFPADIIQFYSTHLLECSNDTMKIRLYLVPLVKVESIASPKTEEKNSETNNFIA